MDYALRAMLPPGWSVRVQSPIWLDDESEPEPDLAVAHGQPGDYRDTHPRHPALVIEVAESSLGFDRRDKGSLYARAGIQDYWIVNVVDRTVEVYREPMASGAAPYGWSYRAVARLTPPAVVELAAVTGARVAIADLLP